jgi:hypothetical protein
MIALSLILSFLFQSPLAPVVVQPTVQHLSVVVGLKDGQKVAVDDAQFTGFIETRDNGGVLLYRQKDFHGELNLSAIQRITFTYQKGRPYLLVLTLRNGHLLTVESDKRDFIMLKGIPTRLPARCTFPRVPKTANTTRPFSIWSFRSRIYA